MRDFIKIVLLISVGTWLFGCESHKENVDVKTSELIGQYRLAAIDPGSGDNKFTNVISDKVVQFFENGLVTSNGNLYDVSVESIMPSQATYFSIEMRNFDCLNKDLVVLIELSNDQLVLNYSECTPDTCRALYLKLD